MEHSALKNVIKHLLKDEDGQSFAHTIDRFLEDGQKIAAIKELRSVSGIGLKEAKDFIELHFDDCRPFKFVPGYYANDNGTLVYYVDSSYWGTVVYYKDDSGSLGSILGSAIYKVGAKQEMSKNKIRKEFNRVFPSFACV